jgi:hypothetical protein
MTPLAVARLIVGIDVEVQHVFIHDERVMKGGASVLMPGRS